MPVSYTHLDVYKRQSLLSYPSEEALHQLDPTQLLGGSLNMSDHLMLTSVTVSYTHLDVYKRQLDILPFLE